MSLPIISFTEKEKEKEWLAISKEHEVYLLGTFLPRAFSEGKGCTWSVLHSGMHKYKASLLKWMQTPVPSHLCLQLKEWLSTGNILLTLWWHYFLYGSFACMYVWAPCTFTPGVLEAKKAQHPRKPELEISVRHHVRAGSQTQILSNSSKCFIFWLFKTRVQSSFA